jgi:adenylate kinase family enzyme
MTAQATHTATLPAFLPRVRLRAERRVLWLRRLWGSAADTRALAITDDDVDQILGDPAALDAAERLFQRGEARELTERIEQADLLAGADAGLTLLRTAFGLSDAEVDLLTLCLAVEADPMLRRVFGYLHDDATLGQPTPWLAATLFGHGLPARGVGGPASPLFRRRLARPVDGYTAGSVMTPWSADPFVVALVLHRVWSDPILAFELVDVAAAAAALTLYPNVLDEAERFFHAVDRARAGGPPVELELIGVTGSGRRTVAAQLCARLGMNLLNVDGAALQQGGDTAAVGDRLQRVARLARAADASLYWKAAPELDEQAWRALEDSCPLMIFGSDAPRPRTRDSAPRKSIALPPLGASMRRELWQRLTDRPMPREAAEWLRTPSELVSAAAVAAAGPDEIVATCRQLVHHAPGEVFATLACPYTWEDIVLTGSVRQSLRELEEHAQLRFAVFEEWGFAKLHPMGRGLTALFAGPSGTGKTMAAQVLARALGMDLYRVDLAGVVNKYVGETEKRLKQVFDACERANVLLFFDEADALFGQRTQVRDAHDRFANIEIDYLLQRMEEFGGIAVLATNRRGDLDSAFLRRLRFIIEFTRPGVAERRQLWRRVLPERTPAGAPLLDGIDFDRLASELAISGADIKSAALGAAFLARAEESRIGMRHVVRAARRELTKQGIELRPGDFGALS